MTVQDNGIGVDPEQASRIFGMFTRAEPARGRRDRARGLPPDRRGARRTDLGRAPRGRRKRVPFHAAALTPLWTNLHWTRRRRPGRFPPRNLDRGESWCTDAGVLGSSLRRWRCSGWRARLRLPTLRSRSGLTARPRRLQLHGRDPRARVHPGSGRRQDRDGVDDRTAIEIIRPEGVQRGPEGPGDHRPEPVLHDARARQRGRSCIDDIDGDGLNDKWPLFYDNYFVPRGYAVILAEMDGTGELDRLPDARRPRRRRLR